MATVLCTSNGLIYGYIHILLGFTFACIQKKRHAMHHVIFSMIHFYEWHFVYYVPLNVNLNKSPSLNHFNQMLAMNIQYICYNIFWLILNTVYICIHAYMHILRITYWQRRSWLSLIYTFSAYCKLPTGELSVITFLVPNW